MYCLELVQNWSGLRMGQEKKHTTNEYRNILSVNSAVLIGKQ